MTAWQGAVLALLVGVLAPATAAVCRGTAHHRLAALSLTSTTATALLVALAQASARPSYTDVALLAAVLGPVGMLTFARCLPQGAEDTPGTDCPGPAERPPDGAGPPLGSAPLPGTDRSPGAGRPTAAGRLPGAGHPPGAGQPSDAEPPFDAGPSASDGGA